MEASSGKKVGENPQNEISHGASTNSYCHQLSQPTVDTGNNHHTDSDQVTELAENFHVHLIMNDLGVEICAGSFEGSGSQPVKEMPTGDPKSVSPRGAGKQDSGVQQVEKAAEHSDYHHSLPLGQDTAPNLLTEDFREAKEESSTQESEKNELIKKLQQMHQWKEDECKRLKEDLENQARQIQALENKVQESSTQESEKNELIKKLQQMHQWKEDECKRLKEDLENQARQIQALENKVQVLGKKTGQVEALESKIEKHQWKEDECNRLKEDLENQARQIQALENKVQSLEKQCEELKTDNNNLHQNAAFLLKTLRKKEEQLNTLYQQMQQEIQNVEQYKKEAQDRLQQLATSFQTMKQRCKKRAAIILEKDAWIDRLTWVLIYIISYLFIYTPTYAPFDNL